MTLKRTILTTLFVLAFTVKVWAVPTCTITGPVDDGAGNPVVNGTITFNTLFVQVVSGNTISQTLVSTTTDDSGDLVPISLAQGVYVQVTINGGAPVTAIVPFASSITFAQLLSNVVTNPTLAVLTVTGSSSQTCTAGDGTIFFDSDDNKMKMDENCDGFYRILAAANDIPDCQDAGGNHLNYIASSRMLTCGTSSSGGGGGGSNPQTDATAILFNQADNTKLMKFDLSGLSTATTRTFTVPNRSATMATTTGTLTSGNLAKFDASGNIVDDGISILTLSGNTTKAGTVSGALVGGNLLKSDASGNIVDAGVATGGKTLLSGASQGLSSGTTVYFPAASFTQGGSALEINNNSITSLAGTIKNLYCATAVAPGSAKSFAFTYRKNGVSQTLTCTVSGTGTTCNDTTHTFTVVAGDLLSIQSVPTGSPTSSTGNCSAEFDPS